jgi:hypothetical protein
VSFAIGAAAAADADGACHVVAAATYEGTPFRETIVTVPAAATTLAMHAMVNTGSGSYSSRSLSVTPVRVS